MSAFLGSSFDTGTELVPGTVPAWALVFRHDDEKPLRTIGSDSYVGTVTAKLPVGLAAGTYEIVIEGMTAEDYGAVIGARAPLTASLHMWWKDAPTGVLGGLARFTGLDNPLAATTPEPPVGSLVAELGVVRLRRRPGQRRVEVVVSAWERVVTTLDRHRVDGRSQTEEDPTTSALKRVISDVTDGVVPVVGYRLEAARPTTGADAATIPAGSGLDAVKALTQQVRDALGLGGLPIAMIRDGALHIGEWTSRTADPRALDVERRMDDHSGLLAIERGADQPREGRTAARLLPEQPPRPTFAVTALGRPDLKPGDRISLVLPPDDFVVTHPSGVGSALLTALPTVGPGAVDPDGQPATCRIIELCHQISRERGFLTTFRAVVLTGGDDGWDRVTPGEQAVDHPRARPAGVPFTDSARGAASTIRSAISDVTDRALRITRPRPAIVHSHDVTRHRSDVWSADTAPDGLGGTAARAPITERVHGEQVHVPHLTPFAWGSYGLVLPRYPGTRVVLANVGDGTNDFVDVGALWPDDTGPHARPGDYWLALPVGIEDRELLRDPDRQQPNDGPATHDLVDGDGTRVIETRRFVLRVTDRLTQVPDRPEPADGFGDGTVVIESRSGDAAPARIVLSGDGSVTISATSITFDAGDGDIALKAKDVRVKLAGGTMDVS